MNWVNVKFFYFSLLLALLPLNSGCSAIKCREVTGEVDEIRDDALAEFAEIERLREFITPVKGINSSVGGYDKYREALNEELLVAARIIVNNQGCFSLREVAESQEMIERSQE